MDLMTTAAILLSLLGHDDFRTRENAERKLEKMGSVIMPVLCQGARSDDAEIVSRSNRLRRGLWTKELDKMEMPWIDCLPTYVNEDMVPYDPYYLSSSYLIRANTAGHNMAGPDWKNFREATRMMCKDLITNGTHYDTVQQLLSLMWEKHNRYDVKTGRYKDPEPEPIGPPAVKDK